MFRGISNASSGLTVGGKSTRTPTFKASSTILFIARPIKQIERPAFRPASAKVLTRATLLAKVVATTICSAEATKLVILSLRLDSERPRALEKILVLSQIKALTPGRATSLQSNGSQGSPTNGFSSSLKSPV